MKKKLLLDRVHELWAAETQKQISAQLKEMRSERNITQSRLACLCDMKQTSISRLEDPEYLGWKFKTLLRITKALDARIKISIVRLEDNK